MLSIEGADVLVHCPDKLFVGRVRAADAEGFGPIDFPHVEVPGGVDHIR